MTSDDPRLSAGLREEASNYFTAFLAGQFLAPAEPGPLGLLFRFLPPGIRDHLPDHYLAALTP
jgi:hypothetical protein